MADDRPNGNVDPLVPPLWPFWPGESVLGVIEDAYAVEREARALEREAGGYPLIGGYFEFRLAVLRLRALAQALQRANLNEQHRQVLDNVGPAIDDLAARIDGSAPPASPTTADLLAAAERLQTVFQSMKATKKIPADEEDQFGEIGGTIDSLVINIRDIE